MKKKFTLIAIVAIIATAGISAQDSGFGAGLIFGNPTGLSLKKWTGESSAIAAGIAWNFNDNGFFNIHADFLRHNFDLISVSKGKLPFYYGLGGKLGFGNDFKLTARVPLGLDYMFESAPFDIFIEVVPGLGILPSLDFDWDAGIGVRYFF